MPRTPKTRAASYNTLIAAGFSPAEARALRDKSPAKIAAAVEGRKIIKALDTTKITASPAIDPETRRIKYGAARAAGYSAVDARKVSKLSFKNFVTAIETKKIPVRPVTRITYKDVTTQTKRYLSKYTYVIYFEKIVFDGIRNVKISDYITITSSVKMGLKEVLEKAHQIITSSPGEKYRPTEMIIVSSIRIDTAYIDNSLQDRGVI